MEAHLLFRFVSYASQIRHVCFSAGELDLIPEKNMRLCTEPYRFLIAGAEAS